MQSGEKLKETPTCVLVSCFATRTASPLLVTDPTNLCICTKERKKDIPWCFDGESEKHDVPNFPRFHPVLNLGLRSGEREGQIHSNPFSEA